MENGKWKKPFGLFCFTHSPFSILYSLLLLFPLSCGYTHQSVLPRHIQTIAVTPFENQTFEPGLEIDFNKKLTDRVLFERIARLSSPSKAEAVLKGNLLEYEREPLRYTDAQDVQEYRLRLVVQAVLEDAKTGEVLWSENRFSGESSFFTSGALTKSEQTARDELFDDLARRLVSRLAEGWE